MEEKQPEEKPAIPGVTMFTTWGCLVVPIQVELYDRVMLRVQEDILKRIRDTGVKGVVLDLAGVDIIDSFLARAISDTAKMVSLMGARAVITGLKAEVAASLTDLDIDFEGVLTAKNPEDGLRRLEPLLMPEEKEEEAEETKWQAGEEMESGPGEGEEAEEDRSEEDEQ